MLRSDIGLSHMYLGLLWCVGLLIVTSDGLADRLQCLAISVVMKAHKSEPRCRVRDSGESARASWNACKFASEGRDGGGIMSGGGDMFLGRGDALNISLKAKSEFFPLLDDFIMYFRQWYLHETKMCNIAPQFCTQL